MEYLYHNISDIEISKKRDLPLTLSPSLSLYTHTCIHITYIIIISSRDLSIVDHSLSQLSSYLDLYLSGSIDRFISSISIEFLSLSLSRSISLYLPLYLSINIEIFCWVISKLYRSLFLSIFHDL